MMKRLMTEHEIERRCGQIHVCRIRRMQAHVTPATRGSTTRTFGQLGIGIQGDYLFRRKSLRQLGERMPIAATHIEYLRILVDTHGHQALQIVQRAAQDIESPSVRLYEPIAESGFFNERGTGVHESGSNV